MLFITEFLQKVFDTSSFPPRWVCGEWTEFHGWLYIGSDLAIWSAYFAIPFILIFFIIKRQDIPFKKIFWLFIAFIFFCGATHLVDALIFWVPVYRFNAVLLFGTAIVSWATVISLFKILPKTFTLKTTDELEEIIRQKTTELKETNQKLAESEKQFKTLVDNNPDIISRIGKDLKHKFVNKSIKKYTGKESEYYIGKTHYELGYSSRFVDKFVSETENVFKTGKPSYYNTEFWSDKDNYYMISIVPLKNETAGTVEDVLTVTRDITQQKKAEVELKHNFDKLRNLSNSLQTKNKQLQNFANIVSHNLRSPVGNLNTLFKFFEEATIQEERDSIFSKIKKVTYNLEQTIDDLTQLVKIHQQPDIKKEKLHFEDTLKDLMESMSGKIQEAGAKITFDFSKCPEIQYPKVYLESIILNLLTNALKYRSPHRKPEIHFETKEEKGKISLTCTDNGLGIDLQKYGKKIFQLNKTFHRNTDSRGVGLFMTKNQLESLGGGITMDSKPGEGTTFTVAFNYRPETRKENLWIIDSGISKYSLLRNLSDVPVLKKVQTFSNVKTALDEFKDNLDNEEIFPDIILIEINIHEKKEKILLGELEDIKAAFQQNVLIYLYGDSNTESVMKSIKTKGLVNNYLLKPVTKENLTLILKN